MVHLFEFPLAEAKPLDQAFLPLPKNPLGLFLVERKKRNISILNLELIADGLRVTLSQLLSRPLNLCAPGSGHSGPWDKWGWNARKGFENGRLLACAKEYSLKAPLVVKSMP